MLLAAIWRVFGLPFESVTPIVPDTYPMIRVVLSVSRERTEGNPWNPLLNIVVYYGEYVRPLNPDDIGDQHEWLLDMEDRIKRAIIPGQGWRARGRDGVGRGSDSGAQAVCEPVRGGG